MFIGIIMQIKSLKRNCVLAYSTALTFNLVMGLCGGGANKWQRPLSYGEVESLLRIRKKMKQAKNKLLKKQFKVLEVRTILDYLNNVITKS